MLITMEKDRRSFYQTPAIWNINQNFTHYDAGSKYVAKKLLDQIPAWFKLAAERNIELHY